jgi:biopolymer transport protein ExbB
VTSRGNRIPAAWVLLLVLALAAPWAAGAVPAGEPGGAPAEAPAPEADGPPAGEAPGEEAEGDDGDDPPTVWELLQAGGPLMYPIYFCSFLMVTFAIERAISLRRRKIVPPDFVQNLRELVRTPPIDRDKVLTYCQANPSPISRIFQAAVKRLDRPLPDIEKSIEDAGAREVRDLRKYTRVLSGVASVAPLLGLLGTVLGMIGAFQEIGGGKPIGSGAGEALAENIYEALVTTASGLSVAIPSLVLYLIITSRIDRLVAEMDDLTMEFVEGLADEKQNAAA